MTESCLGALVPDEGGSFHAEVSAAHTDPSLVAVVARRRRVV